MNSNFYFYIYCDGFDHKKLFYRIDHNLEAVWIDSKKDTHKFYTFVDAKNHVKALTRNKFKIHIIKFEYTEREIMEDE